VSDIALKVENLYKRYRLGAVDRQAFKEDVISWWASVQGKPDPYEQYITSNELAAITDSEDMKKLKARFVWALQDINFEVKKGEIVGIIGKNGAGKSTLLKILSKTTTPTKGQVKVNGRIASLLEVGTGFHGDLTGRENIYLNGAILGMNRNEIKKHLDEIIAFAGVDAYIDTPVKRYSSGMYVRLAFAVGAHLLSDILIVDEVLAVGDAEFQKKCIGKMQNVSTGEGKTVLFVSHNMASVQALCNLGLFIESGVIKMFSNMDDVALAYQNSKLDNKQNYFVWGDEARPSNLNVKILSMSLLNDDGYIVSNLTTDDSFRINIEFQVTNPTKLGLTIIVSDINDTIIFCSINNHEKKYYGDLMSVGQYQSYCTVPSYLLNTGNYSVSLIIFGTSLLTSMEIKNIFSFEILDGNIVRGDFHGYYAGIIRPFLNWETKRK